MIELENTYLVKKIPSNLRSFESKEIIDVYLPKDSQHCKLRLRKNGNTFEMTKKEPVSGTDSSRQEEQTIILSKIEFDSLNQQLVGKRVRKIRYFYNYNNQIAEFDIFQDDLIGLVLVDFEFKTLNEKDSFKMPDFCLADVTQEAFTAGGVICGKSYKNIENKLKEFDYNKLFLT